jgi:hypothetical protein
MYLNKYKTKLKRTEMEAINATILIAINYGAKTGDDKLLLSALAEVYNKLEAKLINVQKESKVSFSPAQAIALHLLYIDFVIVPTSFIGNCLLRISNEIHKLYN